MTKKRHYRKQLIRGHKKTSPAEGEVLLFDLTPKKSV